MKETTVRVLRWNVSRLHDLDVEVPPPGKKGAAAPPAQSPSPRRRLLEIAVSPAQSGFVSFLEEKKLLEAGRRRELRTLAEDRLEWWTAREEEILEGWVAEEPMLEALQQRNVYPERPLLGPPSGPRQVEEDMVFLQFVDGKDADRFDELWYLARESTGLPELTELVKMGTAQWCDFTRQARRMAKGVYRRLLGEIDTEEAAR